MRSGDLDKSEFASRVMMSLVGDMAKLAETTDRVRVQVVALAKELGVKPPSQIN